MELADLVRAELMARHRATFLMLVGALLAFRLAAEPFDLADYRLVDLTHPYNADTVFWPTSPPERFKLERLHYGETPGGFFYSANTFCLPEHGGTHLDAPIHFGRDRDTADKVPLERLIGPVVVIDVSEKAAKERDYRVTPSDVLAFEKQHGRIEAGTRVLVRTGWSSRWPDATAYLGHATDATQLHFPSYGAEAARLLVEERRVGLLGIDTASIDYGPATDFPVHRIVGGAQRSRPREPHGSRCAPGPWRHPHCAADEDRGRVRRTDARRRARAARIAAARIAPPPLPRRRASTAIRRSASVLAAGSADRPRSRVRPAGAARRRPPRR